MTIMMGLFAACGAALAAMGGNAAPLERSVFCQHPASQLRSDECLWSVGGRAGIAATARSSRTVAVAAAVTVWKCAAKESADRGSQGAQYR
jgi:hypothetical protein